VVAETLYPHRHVMTIWLRTLYNTICHNFLCIELATYRLLLGQEAPKDR